MKRVYLKSEKYRSNLPCGNNICNYNSLYIGKLVYNYQLKKLSLIELDGNIKNGWLGESHNELVAKLKLKVEEDKEYWWFSNAAIMINKDFIMSTE